MTIPGVDELLAAMAVTASRRDARVEPPDELMAQVRRLRLGAAGIPVARGGWGLGVAELFELVVDMARADPNVTHILRNHFAFVEAQLGFGDQPQVGRWVDEAVAGRLFGSASGEAGVQLGALRTGTKLEPDGDGYRLSGVKKYCTGAPYADWINVLAVTPAGDPVTVIIARERDGVICEDDWDGMGQRLSGTCTVVMDGVRVDPHEVLDARSSGSSAPGALSGIGSYFGLYLTAIVAGIAQSAVDEAIALLGGRERTFTHAPSELAVHDPHLLAIVGELSASAYAARHTVIAAATTLQAALGSRIDGVPDQRLATQAAVEAAQAKIVVDAIGVTAGSRLYDVAGASAVRTPVNADRHWRNARTLASHNPAVYKARAIGDLMLNDAPIPTNGYF